MNDKRLDINDEQLLDSFFKEFKEARQPIADDGFTERVMSALPQREAVFSLRRYSLWLNVVGVVGVIGLMIYLGFFTSTWELLQGFFTHLLVTAMTYDYDALLVRLMLFLHRLPGLLPSAPQLTAIVISTIVLMTLGIDRIVRRAQS